MPVASPRIGLPELDQRVRDRAAGFVLDMPMNDDALAYWLATLCIIEDEVVIGGADLIVAE